MSTLITQPLGLGFVKTMTSACPLHNGRRTTTTPQPSGGNLCPTRVSCQQKAGGGEEPRPPSSLLMDRRDVLVALGGLYGAAGKMALAKPVMPPDLSKCLNANSPGIKPDDPLLKCCPPYTSVDIVDYNFPKTALRVRRPAQEVINDDDYMTKYNNAVRAMKKLNPDHPWNYYQQAKVHCAYCSDSYDQVGYEEVPVQVHGSWFFPPWHRYYLHFYERILGKLINDDTFALPFWNFDSSNGMVFPSLFTDTSSCLYNANRNPEHMPPAVLDYQYSYKKGDRDGVTDEEKIKENLAEMRTSFKQSLPLAELFMGDPLRAGEPSTMSYGRLETIHNTIHQWVGTTDSPNLDMGNFVTAARDSVFYCHHSNVDRLWHVYQNLRGNNVEFNDPDWLDSTFLFYDENEQLVRVKVRDSLKMSNFCYTYEEVPIEWLGKVSRKKKVETKTGKELSLVPVTEFGSVPRKLESTIRVIVPRPKKNRTKSEKEDNVEVLFIKGIQANTTGAARFDVFVAKPYGDLAGPSKGDLVGSYVKLPHTTEKEVTPVKGKVKDGDAEAGADIRAGGHGRRRRGEAGRHSHPSIR